MPCKTSKKSKHEETRGKTNEFKSKLAYILEASESTRMRMEGSLHKDHEDHIAGKGINSCLCVLCSVVSVCVCLTVTHFFERTGRADCHNCCVLRSTSIVTVQRYPRRIVGEDGGKT